MWFPHSGWEKTGASGTVMASWGHMGHCYKQMLQVSTGSGSRTGSWCPGSLRELHPPAECSKGPAALRGLPLSGTGSFSSHAQPPSREH